MHRWKQQPSSAGASGWRQAAEVAISTEDAALRKRAASPINWTNDALGIDMAATFTQAGTPVLKLEAFHLETRNQKTRYSGFELGPQNSVY